MNAKNILVWAIKIIFLAILYIPIWMIGSMIVANSFGSDEY
jgi:hypothetical protein